MNIELLLRQFLYTHKYVSYPGIGKLQFGPGVQMPDSLEKGEAVALQDLNFSFSLHEEMDKDFIAFVSTQTGKIKPLAAADVESYFMLSKQFINIGKSFVVDGIGSVDKLDNGTYAFTPGYFLPVSEASAAPSKPLKVRESQPVMPKTEPATKSAPVNKKLVLVVIGAISLVLIGWAVYHFVFANKGTGEVNTPVVNKDTNTAAPKDTSTVNPTQPVTTTVGFKAIVEQRFTRLAAEARAAKLRTFGHDAKVDSAAPATFLIYVPVKDTTISVDTLQLTKITGKRPRFTPM